MESVDDDTPQELDVSAGDDSEGAYVEEDEDSEEDLSGPSEVRRQSSGLKRYAVRLSDLQLSCMVHIRVTYCTFIRGASVVPLLLHRAYCT